MRLSRWVLAALAGVVAVVILIGGLALRHPSGSQSATPNQGSAHTLFGAAGYDLTVEQVERQPQLPGAPSPAVGLSYLRLQISFQNHSTDQQRADPLDFTLRDSSGTREPSFFGAGDGTCGRWQRADLHAAGHERDQPRDREAKQVGPSFGPVPLCFQVARGAEAALTLLWHPDLGLATPTTEIPLR